MDFEDYKKGIEKKLNETFVDSDVIEEKTNILFVCLFPIKYRYKYHLTDNI